MPFLAIRFVVSFENFFVEADSEWAVRPVDSYIGLYRKRDWSFMYGTKSQIRISQIAARYFKRNDNPTLRAIDQLEHML